MVAEESCRCAGANPEITLGMVNYNARMPIKILISTSSFSVESSQPLDLLRQEGFEVTLNPYGRKLTKEETVSLLAAMDGVIAGTEVYSADVLEKLNTVKVISRCGAGTDGIDVNVLRMKNITLLNTPDVHIVAVAELTLAGLLSLSRRVAQSHGLLVEGRWEKMMGTNLAGKTAGIVGYGKVGRRVADILHAFGCTILVYDPFLAVQPEGVRHVHELNIILAESDIITLHVPLTDETRYIISGEAFLRMRPHVMVVNTSRGGLIDEKALAEFLQAHPAAGAYLDVFEKEPYDGILRTLPNVVLTPHVGTFTRQTRVNMEMESVRNVINFFKSNG
jgi:D-3-phosphoglycerate dehydrogenase / 2-oxoglutarate reductase